MVPRSHLLMPRSRHWRSPRWRTRSKNTKRLEHVFLRGLETGAEQNRKSGRGRLKKAGFQALLFRARRLHGFVSYRVPPVNIAYIIGRRRRAGHVVSTANSALSRGPTRIQQLFCPLAP